MVLPGASGATLGLLVENPPKNENSKQMRVTFDLKVTIFEVENFRDENVSISRKFGI